MKFVKTSLVAVGSIFCLASQVMAADGEINFVGTITASTCSAVVDDVNGGAAGTVTLGNVSALSLAQAGDTAGAAAFRLSLVAPVVGEGQPDNCDLSEGTATVRFLSMNGTGGPNGEWLGLEGAGTEGVARNVAIQIKDATGADVQLGQSSSIYTDLTEPMRFTANYIALGAATAGQARAKAAFSIDYK